MNKTFLLVRHTVYAPDGSGAILKAGTLARPADLEALSDWWGLDNVLALALLAKSEEEALVVARRLSFTDVTLYGEVAHA